MVYPKIESKMSVLKRHLYFQNARADFAMAVGADYPGGAMETFVKITKKVILARRNRGHRDSF